MCQEVAVIPFLWVVPLSIYLLTFILTFDSPRWYRRATFAVIGGVLVLAQCALLAGGAGRPLWQQVLVYCLSLFATGMLCHAELSLAPPPPAPLTSFRFVFAAGG